MGDFVKGPLPTCYPEKLTFGLHLHRRIDSLSQNSPHTKQSRQRLRPIFGHGRGIIIDIFYDYFLASGWADFSTEPLTDYASEVYQLLQENLEKLPRGLQQIAPYMIEHNWLASYQHRHVVGRALQRIAYRLSKPLPLAEGVYDLIVHEEALRQDFKCFMMQAAELVKQEIAMT
jgi:acyl carrier protein phosphodiesterase